MSLQKDILLPASIIIAVVASPLRPSSLRDVGLVLVGMILMLAATRTNSEKRRDGIKNNSNNKNEYNIETIEDLRELIPAGASGTSLSEAKKVIGYLDDQMISFIAKSPLLYLATLDVADDRPFVSPKGDEPGFVTILSNSDSHEQQQHTLVIPDRPGNRLLFGLQNIVAGLQSTKTKWSSLLSTAQETSPRVSVLFEVPGTGTTLRCGGTARLSTDPDLLKQHVARGCPPKLVILIDVDHAFFHCAKAYLRSKVWDPESWILREEQPKVTFGRYFTQNDGVLAKKIDDSIDVHYMQVQKAIDGDECEHED